MSDYNTIIFTSEGAIAVNMPELITDALIVNSFPCMAKVENDHRIKEAIANGAKLQEDFEDIKWIIPYFSDGGIEGKFYPIPSGYKVVVTPVAITRSGIESKEKTAKLIKI